MSAEGSKKKLQEERGTLSLSYMPSGNGPSFQPEVEDPHTSLAEINIRENQKLQNW